MPQPAHHHKPPLDPDFKQKPSAESPYSQEAEEALIGAALISANAVNAVVRYLKPQHFFFLKHAYIWQAMLKLHEADMAIDPVTVGNELRSMGKLEDIGGAAYLTHLIANTPTSVHAEVYAQIVLMAAYRRSVMVASDDMKSAAMNEDIPAEQALRDAVGQLEDMIVSIRGLNAPTIVDHLERHMSDVEQAISKAGDTPVMGVPSGIKSLDALLDGFHRRKVYVVGGRKHMGKTGFMTTCLVAACRNRKKVAFFNVADGSERDVLNNILSQLTDIEPFRIESGRMSSMEYQRYVQACGEMSNWDILIISKKGMSPREIYYEARAKHQRGGLDIVFIDYLQRMSPGTPDNDAARAVLRQPEREQLNFISQALTKMADVDMLNVPIVVGAQINRASTHGKDKRPTSEHLKGSGNLEEDADVVLLIHREGYYDKNYAEPDVTEIIVDKNKVTRQLGTIKCRTSQASARFMDNK